jgi:hypothetical protein
MFSESLIPEFVVFADGNVVHIHKYKQCYYQTSHYAYTTEASGLLVDWLGMSCRPILR